MKIFRTLTDEEAQQFREWAEDNYKPFTPIDGLWHPVVQAECVRINDLAGKGLGPSAKHGLDMTKKRKAA